MIDKVTLNVLFDTNLSLSAKALFFIVYKRLNYTNCCFKILQPYCKEPKEVIQAAFKELVDSGYLRKEYLENFIHKEDYGIKVEQ